MSEVELTFTREFKEDVETQVAWLEGEHPSWIPKLERGLVEAFELLVTFPRAGAAIPPEPMRKSPCCRSETRGESASPSRAARRRARTNRRRALPRTWA